MHPGFLIGGAALAIVLILVVQFWPQPEQEPPAREPVVTAPPDPIVEEQPEPVPVPPVEEPVGVVTVPVVSLAALNESDAFVRERIAGLGLPGLWTQRDELIRRLAVVVDNAARGELPRRQLAFMAPSGVFPVRERGGRVYLDPAGYERFDGYLDTLEGVDPVLLSDFLALVDSLVVEALGELGNRRGVVEQVSDALLELESVPVLWVPPELVPVEAVYQYADPQLESLSLLQKQVLRMGPRNVNRLKAWLGRLKAALRSS
ncbi:MAG: DUF3014 domain-containing protein [Pseudomonadales bacterium]|nr:DUF3014 domain-containing protein [Pseudomonadales bacterium]